MPGRLPNFLIIGAPRCGTTSLAIWLGEHPDVFVSTPKELHFFNKPKNLELGLDWYREQFAAAGDAHAVGEGTPNYMLPTPAIDAIAETLPEVRLIACLRDPVARAYSNWRLSVSLGGIESRSFTEAVEQELAARRDPLERPWRTWRDTPGIGMDYVARGDYLPQLERLCEIWGRERLHVVLFDDLSRDPHAVFAQTCEFLDVDPDVVPPTLGVNFNSFRSHTPRRGDRVLARFAHGRAVLERRLATERAAGSEVVPQPARDLLRAHFAPRNAQLAEWLGRDLSAWDRGERVPAAEASEPVPFR